MDVEIYEDIVIVGAGISGLTTALGLHRLGLRSLVLESSESLKFTGYALTTWPNAWRALDAVGVGDLLRKNSILTEGFKVVSSSSIPLGGEQSHLQGDLLRFNFESRCIKRKDLLETLESQLPHGTIRYSSKAVSIEENGNCKLLHLADGSVVKTKVLIGCDGGNSMVAKWLGLEDPVRTGRSAIRGLANYLDGGHGFEPKFHVYSTLCVHFGFVPCDEKSLYWFCNFSPSFHRYNEENQDPLIMKKFVASQLHDAPPNMSNIVERTELDCICYTPLRLKFPWNVLLGNFVKNNVCVVGDAFHPMTPAIGQGGGSSLEDSVVLARCLGKALATWNFEQEYDEYYIRVEKGLEKYVKERRWRILSLLTAAYIVGFVQHSGNKVIGYLRKRFLSKNLVKIMARMGDFDCGDLTIPQKMRI